MKKIISLALIVVIVFSTTVSVFADRYDKSSTEEFTYLDENNVEVRIVTTILGNDIAVSEYRDGELTNTARTSKGSSKIYSTSENGGSKTIKVNDMIEENNKRKSFDISVDEELLLFSTYSQSTNLGNYNLLGGKVMNVRYSEVQGKIDSITIKSGTWKTVELVALLVSSLVLPASIAGSVVLGWIASNIVGAAVNGFISVRSSVPVSAYTFDYTFYGQDTEESWYSGEISGIKYLVETRSNNKYDGQVFYSNAINYDEAISHTTLFYNHMSYAVYGIPYYPAN